MTTDVDLVLPTLTSCRWPVIDRHLVVIHTDLVLDVDRWKDDRQRLPGFPPCRRETWHTLGTPSRA